MSKEFYVYVYLDPRKKGEFNYENYKFECEPFYVGKGNGSRFSDHLKKSKLTNNKENSLKNESINSILKDGLQPIIKIVFKSEDEVSVFSIESLLIKLIGRKNVNTGILTNLSAGGGGCSGRFVTDEYRKKQSDKMKNYHKNNPVSQEICKKISDALLSKNMTRSKETRDKIGAANKNRKFSEEYINSLKIIRKGPKLTHRKHYKLISPTGETFNFLEKEELLCFIHKNNLSERKLIGNINKGVIKQDNVRAIVKEGRIKTKNCIGWESIKE